MRNMLDNTNHRTDKSCDKEKPRIIETVDELKDWLGIFPYECVIDLETDGLEINCNILGIGVAELESEGVYIVYSDTIWDYMCGRFFSKLKTVVFHNLKFDYKLLLAKGAKFNDSVEIVDTMLFSYVENPDQFHGLKDNVARRLGYHMTTFDDLTKIGKKRINLKDVDVEAVAKYCIDDVVQTGKLYDSYLEGSFNEPLVDLETDLAVVLSEMELNGVKMDRRFLRTMRVNIYKELKQIKAYFRLLNPELNINSGKQLGDLLFGSGRIKYLSDKNTNGSYKTDAFTLNKHFKANPEQEDITKILRYKILEKIQGTYVDNLLTMPDRTDDILHASFNQTVTATGRLSSSKPNLQNIPAKTTEGKELRKAFISRFPNGSIISADYSQVELRILAHLSGDQTLLNAFRNNEDIHRATAAIVFKVPIEQVTDKQRYMCKTLNFALLYQQGPHATAQQLDITVDEAKDFIKLYFKNISGIPMFIDTIKAMTAKNGFSETLFGRRRYFYNLGSKNNSEVQADLRAAVNHPIQGTSADIMKMALVRISKEFKKRNLKSLLIMTVHDEVSVDSPQEEVEEVKVILKEQMEFNQPLDVPLLVNIKSGRSWYECK